MAAMVTKASSAVAAPVQSPSLVAMPPPGRLAAAVASVLTPAVVGAGAGTEAGTEAGTGVATEAAIEAVIEAVIEVAIEAVTEAVTPTAVRHAAVRVTTSFAVPLSAPLCPCRRRRCSVVTGARPAALPPVDPSRRRTRRAVAVDCGARPLALSKRKTPWRCWTARRSRRRPRR